MRIYVEFNDGSEGFHDIEGSIEHWMNEMFPISLAIKEVYVLNRVY